MGALTLGTQGRPLDYGAEAVSPVDSHQIAWFDRFLKGGNSNWNTPPVRLFEMGSNRWRYFDTFPSHTGQSYYLASDGLASIRDDAGKLQPSAPYPSEDILVRDPWRPVPARGGHASVPAGAFERSDIDCRSDVLTYTSEPLREDLHLVGEAIAQIYCQADAPSFDLCAVLSEVHPNGEAYNFTQGYKRIGTDESPVRICLHSTCIRIASGNCLRLSLSADCFPAYSVNPGTGERDEAQWIESRVIAIALSCGGDRPSLIVLPTN